MAGQSSGERRLRNRGMRIVNRNYPGYRLIYPNARETSESFFRDGELLTRRCFETPVGTLTTLSGQGEGTSWLHEAMFKTPDDYAALRFLLRDERVVPDYEAVVEARRYFGPDMVLRGGLPLEPLQSLMSGNMMKLEDFCVEWMENRDEILRLYELIRENHRKIYPVAAESPHTHFNYGGNLIASVVSPEMYETYYMPCYAEAAETLHRHGVLLGCHYDGDCRQLADRIGRSALDYIEAFTPAPDTNMTLAEAYEQWSGKLLWINYPSSSHLLPDEEIREQTVNMVTELPDRERLLIGITEDMPRMRWQDSCNAIMDGLDRFREIQNENDGNQEAV